MFQLSIRKVKGCAGLSQVGGPCFNYSKRNGSVSVKLMTRAEVRKAKGEKRFEDGGRKKIQKE